MRNPGALNVGEPGSRENLEQRHPNWPPTRFASDPFHLRFRADIRHAWWLEARRVGSDWPAIFALYAAWRARYEQGGTT
jgi:hypothetical protein